MVKPFSIQAPEEIAKEYGGNKQKIAEAAQMGIVDPTAAVLAGMFIDKMRAAQQMEQVPQQTIAQQVLGAPQPQAGVPQGMMPPQGAPVAPQQAAPMAPPQEAPPAMAEGGIIGLDVPDTLYDEPSNGGFDDGYAGGGLVAFAPGGTTVRPGRWGEYFEEMASQWVPGIGVTSRKRTAAKNAAVDGVPDSYHLTGDARDFTPPKGMTMAQLAATLKSKFGSAYDVIKESDHVHVEPGPQLGKAVRGGKPVAVATRADAPVTSAGLGATPQAAASAIPSLADYAPTAQRNAEEWWNKNIPEPKNEGLKALAEEARKISSEEYQKKRANEDKWMALAEVGFNMAATNSPYLLQAVGAAAAAALPGARAAKKEREAEKRQAIRDLAEVENITYKQALDKANALHAYAKDQLDIKNADIGRAFQRGERIEGQQFQTSERIAGQNWQSGENRLTRANQIAVAQARPSTPSYIEGLIQDVIAQGYAKTRLEAAKYLKDHGYIGNQQSGAIDANGDGIPDSIANSSRNDSQGSVHLGNI